VLTVTVTRRPVLRDELREAESQHQEAQHARQAAQQQCSRLERELGQVEGRLTVMRTARTSLETVREQITPAEVDVADWALLVRALGPSGIPALLIDQALPELGRLATELLRECYGESVFSIALTTQRESAAGDALLETLDVVVTRGGAPIE